MHKNNEEIILHSKHCVITANRNVNINILPLVEGVTVDYHKKNKYHPRRVVEGDIFSYCGNLPVSSRVIFFLLEVIYRNTLNQRQYVLHYTEYPSEGGIAGCGISLQYHPLLWWAGLRKVREKYHIYTYQWICIKYNIIMYFIGNFDIWSLISLSIVNKLTLDTENVWRRTHYDVSDKNYYVSFDLHNH